MIEKDARDFGRVLFLQRYIRGHKGYVAGGCFKDILSGKQCKDVDVFFCSEADFTLALGQYEKNEDFTEHYANDNVVAFKDTTNDIVVELCRKTYGAPLQMIESFDFTITKFALYDDQLHNPAKYELERDDVWAIKVVYDERLFEDLFLHRLVVNGKMLYPMSTFNRIMKYAKYGFAPCMETKLKVAQAIHGLSDDAISMPDTFYDGID